MDCVKSWLVTEIDKYNDTQQALMSEFFLSEMRLNCRGMSKQRLSNYYDTCISLAKFSRKNGDDNLYLQCLKKLYTRMMAELGNAENTVECRSRCKRYALDSLNFTCQLYKGYEVIEKAQILRRDFAKRASIG